MRPGRVRLLAAGVALVAAAWGAAGAFASAHGRDAKTSVARSVVVTKSVGAPGTYTVTVLVTSRGHRRDPVELRIGQIERRATIDRQHRRARVRVRIEIAGHSLTVRAVGGRTRPVLKVGLRQVLAPKVTPAAPDPSPAPAASSTTSAAPSAAPPPTTTTAAPPAAAASGPPGPGPYDNLVWSDDFTQDWANEGGSGAATEAVPNTWGFDDYGGCGNSPGAQESSYPGSSNTAYLTSQGLAIPVTETGSNSYVSAQLDTRTISGESWQYGTIEASIQLPSGQGLCPAFWMYADSGTGEIDILEAPSFVGGAGASPEYSVFTLHNDNTQQWETAVTPPSWNPSQPNVYGVIWTPTSITWTVNYVPYAEATASSLADPSLWSGFTSGALHLILDDAVGGWPGDPPAGTVYSQPMIVQWVKVYQ